MESILTDMSVISLAAAIKSNLYSFFRYLSQSPVAEWIEAPMLARWHTPVPHHWFNGVVSTRPPEKGAGHAIQETMEFFRVQNVDRFTWWLQPGLDAAPWDRLLNARGAIFDDDTPGMAVDLSLLAPEPRLPVGLQIRLVEDNQLLRVWTRTFTRGYELPQAIHEPLFTLLASAGAGLPCRYYLGYLHDQPVAASTLFLGDGVAGIYNVATLPEVRGRGFGAALTRTALDEARLMGYRAGVLQSSEMGYRVYQRIGFREVCRMEHWIFGG